MSQPAKRFFEFGPYRLDLTERLLLCEGRQVPLTPKVFSLLLLLVQHPRHILGKDEVMVALWPEGMVEESNLTRNISTLRKAFPCLDKTAFLTSRNDRLVAAAIKPCSETSYS